MIAKSGKMDYSTIVLEKLPAWDKNKLNLHFILFSKINSRCTCNLKISKWNNKEEMKVLFLFLIMEGLLKNNSNKRNYKGKLEIWQYAKVKIQYIKTKTKTQK